MNNKTKFIKVDRKEKNFTMVDNGYIQRNDLSWKAKGIMTYILHLPGDWNINLIEVMKHATDGEASFRSGWKELEEKGYVKRYPVKDKETKRVRFWQTVIHEIAKKPHGEKPDVEKPDVEKPDVGNQVLLSTKELSTNKLSTNSPAKAERIPYKEIISYLNKAADRKFNHKAQGNQDLIRARWNEGYSLEDFKQAIDNKVIHAKDSKHFFSEEYLRPSTLFRKSNFDEYVNDYVKKRNRTEKESTTDFDNLGDLLGDDNE